MFYDFLYVTLCPFQFCNHLDGEERAGCETGLSPPVKYIYRPFEGGTSFVAHLCYLCLVFAMLARLFIAALWSPVGKGPLALVCDVHCDFVTFPFGILGHVWYLIVSIPDPCCLSYFALLSLSSWCLVIVVWLFLAVPYACLQFVIMVFPDHTH